MSISEFGSVLKPLGSFAPAQSPRLNPSPVSARIPSYPGTYPASPNVFLKYPNRIGSVSVSKKILPCPSRTKTMCMATGSAGLMVPKFGSEVLARYLDLLAKYPVPTKALTSAFLTLVGDVVCQLIIDKSSNLDLKRTFLFTLLGLVLVGPTLHFWYLYLSKLVTLPGASGALLRLVLDQFLFSPIFIGVFLSTLMTLEGKPSQVVPKLQQEWFSAVVANWQLWIPFQFLNFRFVPQQFQVLAANSIALIWNVILSFKAHKEVLEK